MDNFSDILKEKITTPFLSNFFFGILLFNKKVIYAAFSIGYQDKIGDYYFYNFYPYQNKIELLEAIHKGEIYLCSPSYNLFVLPIVYAAIITGSLPFIKAVFKTLSIRAGIWHTELKKKYAKLITIPKEQFDNLEKEHYETVAKLEQAQGINNKLIKTNVDLTNDKSNLKSQLETTSIEVGVLKLENEKSSSDYKNLQEVNSKLNTALSSKQKTIAEVFQGIWKLEFEFDSPSTRGPGFEYFKIVNGCEIHRADTPDAKFTFRAYIDRYSFQIGAVKRSDAEYPNGRLLTRIKFKKTFSEEEYAFCEYYLLSDDSIDGEEIYTFNKGVSDEKSRVIINRIR